MSTYDRARQRASLCSLAVAMEAVAGTQRGQAGERFGRDPGRILAPRVISSESLFVGGERDFAERERFRVAGREQQPS
jgi:hypothetical protein